MKNYIGILLVFLTCEALACDGCNVYTPAGINTSQNRLGIFARQRTTFGEFSQLGEMITKHAGHANDVNIWGANVLEHYQTYEIRGDFFIKDKWQITGILPVTNNAQFLDDVKRFSVAGLSDPTVLLSYNFISEQESGVKQRLVLGSGMRFPVGFINIEKDGRFPNLDFQPGTGAFSLFGSVSYFITNDKWSSFSALNYKSNGFNSVGYQYGQSINVKTDVFWSTKVLANTFMIQAGVYTEYADHDRSQVLHSDTGGMIVFGTAGFRYLLEDFILQAEYQPVLTQNLYGNAQLLTKNRINVGLTYVL